ncbi:MAG: twin-arginine translocase subunit TatC [Bacteroidota bacterium]|nr:twin-arginine translocase subunit TatC [Bacteroidota bacterium]
MAQKKSSNNRDANDMSFLEHLEVLRGHLLRSLASIAVFTVVAFLFKDIIFNHILFAPKNPEFFTNEMFCRLGHLMNTEKLCINSEGLQIINFEMAGQFRTHLIISFLAGLVLASPYIFFEVYRFIIPALKEQEQRYSRGMVFFTTLLFITGILFGFFVIVPLTINFLGGYSVTEQVENTIGLSSYIRSVTSVTLSAGIAFELPILIYFLTKVGLVTADFMRRYRKHAIVVFLVLSGIITPPDVISQFLVCGPLYILFEISILISARIERKREEREEED